MRAAQALETVTNQVREAFEGDVAKAIISDSEIFAVAATRLGRNATPKEVAEIVAGIASEVDDGLADWLATAAESPAGWFYKQVTER